MVSEDAKRRGREDKSTALLASTLLLPVVGPCLADWFGYGTYHKTVLDHKLLFVIRR